MNTFKTIFHKPLWLFVFVLNFSCTIIQDSDIITEAQLSKLKIKGIEILQQTSKGSASTVATLLYDSTVNITDATTGAKLTRKIRFSLPPLGTLKMKLKSGVNGKTELQVYYMDDGQPYTVRIFQGDSTVEQYRFRYDAYTGTRKVNKFTTILDPVDNLPATYTSVDNLTYTGSTISSILRNPNSTTPTTIPITYTSGPGPGFTYKNITYQSGQANCPNMSSFDSCTGYSTINTGSGSSSYTISVVQTSNSLNQILLEDNKINGGGSSRDYDTYYFHPLMFLRNQVGQGNYMLVIYMMDWWQLGASVNNPNFSSNETVSINFNYGI